MAIPFKASPSAGRDKSRHALEEYTNLKTTGFDKRLTVLRRPPTDRHPGTLLSECDSPPLCGRGDRPSSSSRPFSRPGESRWSCTCTRRTS